MAGTTPRNLPVPGLLCLLLLVPTAAATLFRVGGSVGWRVPESNAQSYNQWAERNRFQKGDSLLFVYQAGKDSVLQVRKEDYSSCNTRNAIKKFTDGNTEFFFKDSGTFYFISGVAENCNKNEKLVVVVMADHSIRSPPPPGEESSSTSYSPSSASMSVVAIMGFVGAALGSLFFL